MEHTHGLDRKPKLPRHRDSRVDTAHGATVRQLLARLVVGSCGWDRRLFTRSHLRNRRGNNEKQRYAGAPAELRL